MASGKGTSSASHPNSGTKVQSSLRPDDQTFLLRATNVSKSYKVGGRVVDALQPTSLSVTPKKVTAIMGRSGSGKTTLLSILAGLLQPTTGTVELVDPKAGARNLFSLSDSELSALRGGTLGVITQGQSLVQSLTVEQNVVLALSIAGADSASAQHEENSGKDAAALAAPDGNEPAAVAAVLERLELTPLAEAYPYELSGGEARRVAVARALVLHPTFLLADEPTSNLDDKSAGLVISALLDAARAGSGVLIATHDHDCAAAADAILTMRDGTLADD